MQKQLWRYNPEKSKKISNQRFLKERKNGED
jgi:hypothetical protein